MRLLSNAIPLLTAAAVGVFAACSDGGQDTSRLTSDLLSSRGATGQVPASRAQADAPMSEAPSAPAAADAGEIDIASLGYEAGDQDAPIRVIEFSDFACGYCRRFHTETWPALEEEYVATGKVLWKYIPMILGIFGENADDAALAGECALAQDRFPAVQTRLFEEQGSWKRADEPREVFRSIVREEGLDVERWERCMEDGSLSERVDQGTTLSRQLGVRGTPSFFVVGYGGFPGAVPLDLFREILDTVYVDVTSGSGSEGG